MKKLIAVIIILSCLLCSCSNQEAIERVAKSPKDTRNSTTNSPANGSIASLETSLPEESSILEAFEAVMKNEIPFVSSDDGSNMYLKDFLSAGGSVYDVELEVRHYSILDMDGDNIPEIVLELSVVDKEGPDFYEVLHFVDGSVYGCFKVYRALYNLKADGTFAYSCGAGDWGYAKLKFISNTCEVDKIAYCESNANNEVYFLNHKPVTAESFIAFSSEQDGKTDAIWYEFNEPWHDQL